MTRLVFAVMLLLGLSLTNQSVVLAAGGSIGASADKSVLVVDETTNGTISITKPDKPEDTDEVRYVEDVTAGTPSVSGCYTPFSTAQNPNPQSTTESGVSDLTSTSFKFTGNKPGTWEETFSVGFSVATEVYDPDTDSWKPGEDHVFDDVTCSITFTVKAVQLTISAQKYIPVKSTLNSDRYAITIAANPAPVTGTITLTATDKLNLYHNATGGEPSNTLSWTTTSGSYTAYMEGKSVSTSVNDQTLTAGYSGVGTEPVVRQVTVCQVSITASRWTKKGQRSDVSLSYFPSDLDIGKDYVDRRRNWFV